MSCSRWRVCLTARCSDTLRCRCLSSNINAGDLYHPPIFWLSHWSHQQQHHCPVGLVFPVERLYLASSIHHWDLCCHAIGMQRWIGRFWRSVSSSLFFCDHDHRTWLSLPSRYCITGGHENSWLQILLFAADRVGIMLIIMMGLFQARVRS